MGAPRRRSLVAQASHDGEPAPGEPASGDPTPSELRCSDAALRGVVFGTWFSQRGSGAEGGKKLAKVNKRA